MGKCIASLAPCTPILFGVHTGQGTRHLLDLCCIGFTFNIVAYFTCTHTQSLLFFEIE
ncbi:hypothetical protein SLEP1_g36835 [Rubroshorea leprosula]|uniref:Uncharacterized protein n=1 Tax=Rubroshorea leprosula TaxID=152421 RepID=A0AAV5KTA7_9ROSI|nr:hypothetical protein SLEP1_g36835 [Rubroshorea leprosula]